MKKLKCIVVLPTIISIIWILAGCNEQRINQEKSFEWKTKSPKTLNINENLLNTLLKKVEDTTFRSIDAILVIKNEKIVLEAYFNGFTKDSLHNTTSVGKSITSALVGIAIKNGHIPSKNTKIVPYFSKDYDIKHLDSIKKNIEIQHFLTMTAGLACNDWDENSPGNTKHFWDVPDDFAFTLNLPMINKNGDKFSYCSGGANLLGEIIRKQSGKSLQKYADEYLFNKIGIKENKWFIVPKPPHNEFAGGGNFLKPRDMARFGLLYLNKGNWLGQQIIPENWVKESVSAQIKTSEDGDYGYFWWINTYKYKDKVLHGFEASGNGGNKITVIPALNLIIVLTGSGYGNEYIEGEQAKTIMEKYIIPSIH